MPLLVRCLRMLFSPVAEWRRIGEEKSTVKSLLAGFVIPMALIPTVASFIGYGFVGVNGQRFRVRGLYWGSAMAIDSFITSLAVYWLGTYFVDWLGISFGAKSNSGRTAQLVAYSYTPAWLAGIFLLWPSLHGLVTLGLYGVYLFYLGIPVLKPGPPEQDAQRGEPGERGQDVQRGQRDQRISYVIISAILLIVLRFLIGLLIVNIIFSFWGDPYLPFSPALF